VRTRLVVVVVVVVVIVVARLARSMLVMVMVAVVVRRRLRVVGRWASVVVRVTVRRDLRIGRGRRAAVGRSPAACARSFCVVVARRVVGAVLLLWGKRTVITAWLWFLVGYFAG
jgi:hypothetical protein